MAETTQQVPSDDAQTPAPAPTPTITIAPSPFDKPSADFVLRTADQVDFHVRRAILEEASGVFSDMFLLPQPSPGADAQSSLPVVDLTEGSKAIEALLRMCYPVSRPEFTSLDELKLVLEAARKYQMDHAMDVLRQPLLLLAAKNPLQAYAIALRFDLADVVRAVARLTLQSLDPCPFTRELDTISATAYYHLLAYRRKCVDAACQVVRDLGWLDDASFVWFKVTTKCTCEIVEGKYYYLLKGNHAFVTPWFQKYLDGVALALSARPYGGLLTGEEITRGDQMCQDAASCNTCKMAVHSDTRRFISKLAAEVDKRVSTITLEIEG